MTARDEAIEVMAQAYLLRLTGDDDRLIERIDDWDRGIAAVMYDAAESIIRADEREEVVLDHESGIVYRDVIEAEVCERLRAQVEALRAPDETVIKGPDYYAALDHVLALLGGGSE